MSDDEQRREMADLLLRLREAKTHRACLRSKLMRAREALGALQCGLHDMADGKLSIESIAGRHALEDWPDRSEIEQTLRDLFDVNRQIGEMEILEQQMFGTE